MIAQHEPEARVARRHEGEWHQEVLAKLLVRSPRRATVVAVEREGIDEDWTPGRELHVVSARVAKYEAIPRPIGGRLPSGAECAHRSGYDDRDAGADIDRVEAETRGAIVTP